MPDHTRPTVIDLFSGAGGLSLGFQAAGCHILSCVDIAPVAGSTLARNLSVLQPSEPPRVIAGDEADLSLMEIERVALGRTPDIVIGGPPCQAFSRVGRGKLDSLTDEGFVGDPRNQLYERF